MKQFQSARKSLLAALLFFLSAPIAQSEILHEWSFDTQSDLPTIAAGCALSIRDGLLAGELPQGSREGYFILPGVAAPAPLRVVMKARCSREMTREGEIYWITSQSPNFDMLKNLKFPVSHDGAWHEYAVPLPAVGVVTFLRLDLGDNGGTFEIDWVRLEENPYPPDRQRAHEALVECATLESDALSLKFIAGTQTFEITDRRTRRLWVADGSLTKALLTGVKKISPCSLEIEFWDHSARQPFVCRVSLKDEAAVAFEIDTASPDVRFFGLNAWPPMFKSDIQNGKLLFCDRSCGVYADQNDKTYGGYLLAVYGNTSTLNMPWIGALDPLRGDGLMTVVDSPADALVQLEADASGRQWPQILWLESMNRFGSPRKLSLHFIEKDGYVAMAENYRKQAAREGKLITLEEKARAKPAVELMKGAPILWGSNDVSDFVAQARQEGLLRGILSNAHHGLRDKSKLRELNRMGYLTSEYENVSDALEGPTGFGSDNLAEVGLQAAPGEGPLGGWVGDTHTYTVRSSPFYIRAMESYVPQSLALYGFNARFVDVSMAVGLMEDYHPSHTYDRQQDMRNRRDAFQWLNQRGLVLGTEHGNDWGIDLVEYTEGSLSGPFWWMHDSPDGWNPSRLRKAVTKSDYKPEYLKYGHGYDSRIPLWQLVYHDCAISSWYWGDTPGFHYEADPSISERKDLFTLLYGGAPLLWRDNTDYDWNKNPQRFMRTIHEACPFHEEVAFRRMLRHEFLNEDKSLQRTSFDGGYEVVANFAEHAATWKDEHGDTIELPSNGYLAVGPGFRQSRLIENGETVLRAEKAGYYRYETVSRRQLGPFELEGGALAFQISPHRWQLALEHERLYRIDLARLAGWSGETAILELDRLGNPVRYAHPPREKGQAILRTGKAFRHFALIPQSDADPLLIYPASGEIDAKESICLSAGNPRDEIFYTLDGSEPGLTSHRYEAEFSLSRDTTLKAALFRNGAQVGNTQGRDFRLRQTLYRSQTLRGGDAPVGVDVSLEGFKSLRLKVGMGGDTPWNDLAVWGEMTFIDNQGEERILAHEKPRSDFQTYGASEFHPGGENEGALTVSGKPFTHGILARSESEILFNLPEGAVRLKGWIGIDDRARKSNPAIPGSAEFVVEGVGR